MFWGFGTVLASFASAEFAKEKFANEEPAAAMESEAKNRRRESRDV